MVKVKRGVSAVSLFEDVERILHSKPKTIFDVGANEGQSIHQFLNWNKEASVYAFEPTQKLFKNLTSTFGPDPRVKLFQMALSDSKGEATFYEYNKSVYNSLLTHAGANELDVKTSYPVTVQTGDDICLSEKLESLDFLKIDAQGADLRVVNGFSKMIEKQAVKIIYLEANIETAYEGQAGFIEILQALTQKNYKLSGIYEQSFRGNAMIWCNLCFICPNLVEVTP